MERDREKKNEIRMRIKLIGLFTMGLMLVLIVRLANLTLIDGADYKIKSESKRVRDVYVTAPRGEIRDRNGMLLAGNKPVFTVQLYKDELDKVDKEAKNKSLLALIRLLEYDGVAIVDESPIMLDNFIYLNNNDYFDSELSPIDEALERVVNAGFLNDYLTKMLRFDYVDGEFLSIPAERAINALKFKGIEPEIMTKVTDGKVETYFKEGWDFRSFQLKYSVPVGSSSLDTLSTLLLRDKSLIKKMADSETSRRILFDLLVEKGLDSGLGMEAYNNSHIINHENNKRKLIKQFPQITMSSSAKDDFVTIFATSALRNFLLAPLNKVEGSLTIYPAQILNEMLIEKGVNLPITVDLSKDGLTPIITYNVATQSGLGEGVDLLIESSVENGVLKDFVSREDIKYMAQESLIATGINPRISVLRDFEYTDIISYNSWLDQYHIEPETSTEEAFKAIADSYKIDESLSKYEIKSMINVISEIEAQGQRAYVPINYAYGIKPVTVAKIEEDMNILIGVGVSVEPVRYYPNNAFASHILGHLGKISAAEEVEKYVNSLGYLPSDMIGKTGIEASFEDELHGKNGYKKVQIDVRGNKTDVLHEEPPVPGDNVYLSLDYELQKVSEDALKGVLRALQTAGTYRSKWGDVTYPINAKTGRPYESATSGAVMAVDVKTGQVLAQATYPQFDPNLFATGISDVDWQSLMPNDDRDPLAPRPLYNIALQTAVQPGSIFKMIVALAALDKGMSPLETITDMGYVIVGDSQFECWLWTASKSTHGAENMYEALRDSCNYYFYSLMLGKNQRLNHPISIKLDVQDIIDVAREFGLNDKTGLEIDQPQEFSGGVPNPEKKIMTMKYLLRQELENQVEKYYVGKRTFDSELKEEIITEILSWTDREEPMTRGEVVKGLSALNLEPEKKLSGERSGLADKIKYTYLNYAGWNISDSLNVSIGQGQQKYSLAQITNYIATLANGGNRFKLSYIDNIKSYDNSKVLYEHVPNPEKVNLKDLSGIDEVKKGMLMVTEQGTGQETFRGFPVKVATKTGTAEKDGINPSTGLPYDNFSWMVAFAPYDDPQIAVATLIFQGGGGKYGAPILRDVIAEYLGLNQEIKTETLPLEPGLTR